MITAELIHNSFLFFFAITLIIKVFLLILNIAHIKGNYESVPEEFSEQISLSEHQKAQKYTITKNKFSIISIAINGAILLIWLETPALSWLFDMTLKWFETPVLQGVGFLLSFILIGALLAIPESLYSNFVIEEKYGFNKMTPAIFVKDFFKQIALTLIIGVPFLWLIVKILYSLGTYWWFYAWAFIMVFQFIMIWAYPKFIAPLFNKFSKLDNEELVGEVEALAKKIDLNFKDYYVMNASIRSSHGNAYFTGFGKNKRVVFFDTLLSTLNTSEVISVLAHELGHFKKKHIFKQIIMSAGFLLLGLFVLGQLYNNPEFFEAFGFTIVSPYLALLLFVLISSYYTFLLTPMFSWLSRKNEFEADEFAATYAKASDLITALLKMYKDNSSSLTPHPAFSKFYYSHPPAKERIDFLKSFS